MILSLSLEKRLKHFVRKKGLQLLNRIATGGFGSVYLTQDIFSGEKWALKLMDFKAREEGIVTRFFSADSQIHCEIYVDVLCPIQKFLENEKVNITIKNLIPYLIVPELLQENGEESYCERISCYKLVEYLCHEEKKGELYLLKTDFLLGFAEVWLSEILDEERLKNISIAQLMELAPNLFFQTIYKLNENNEIICEKAGEKICPFKFFITMEELISQGYDLFIDYGKILARNFFHDCFKSKQFILEIFLVASGSK